MAVVYTTLGGTTKKIVHVEESWSINHGLNGSATMPVATQVVLNSSTGELDPVTAATQRPFGVLSVGCKADGESATYHTQFVMIARAVAQGSVALGARVAATQLDTGDEKLMRYKTAAAGEYVSGIALVSGSDTNFIIVGILRVPYLHSTTPANLAQMPAIANIATADGSDAATTQALANATKAKVNALLGALRTAGYLAP